MPMLVLPRRWTLARLAGAVALLSTTSLVMALQGAAPGTPPAGGSPGAGSSSPRQSDAPRAPRSESGPGEKRGAGVRYGIEKPLPRREGTIRIASFNVENLFDDVDDPTLSGEFDDIKMATPDDRCQAIAAAIRAIDADILCLQEVESLDALRWFRDRYLAEMGYEHMASEDVGYFRGIEQSILSRFPIVRHKVWPDLDLQPTLGQRVGEGWSDPEEDQGQKFQRSPLFAQVQIADGGVLEFFVVHHKAGGRNFRFHREAEALAIIGLVRERLAEEPQARLAVLGDFNAGPREKSLEIYLDPQFGGLFNAWEERHDRNLPREAYLTHSSGRVIDYILLSPAMRESMVPRSFFVLATLAPPDGWDWRSDPHPPGYASDHRPLVIDVVPKGDPAAPRPGPTALWGLAPDSPAAGSATPSPSPTPGPASGPRAPNETPATPPAATAPNAP
ncbi:MAG: endonuclease/exonuclease/phosphatase family protein [Phycisphaeraceae bacterium]|nr:endonuclease/exonuclease/phosphatase family protein [Phycisphaeraceae bacterium]